jgi:hypothetical protein
MISVTIVIGEAQADPQAASQAAPQATPHVPPPPSAAEIREQVRAGLEAAREARAQGNNQRVTVSPEGITVLRNGPGEPSVFIDPRAAQNFIPPQVVDISIAFFIMIAVMVVGWPISRAFGRRIERRGQVATLDAGTMEQLQRIEQAVDAMAIEVERISESQRFMARLQHETGQALPGMQSR